jgi:hypothetical protein
MGTCTPTIDLFGLAFKSRVDCDTLGLSRRLVGDKNRGVRLACTGMGFYFPPTLVEKFLELWIVQARGYLQRRLLLHGDISRTSTSSYRRYGQLDHAAAVTTRTQLET